MYENSYMAKKFHNSNLRPVNVGLSLKERGEKRRIFKINNDLLSLGKDVSNRLWACNIFAIVYSFIL